MTLGVGIDLSLEYGTASIRYRNGTSFDVAKIDGSVAYRRAMILMAEDAASVGDGFPSMLPPVDYWTDLPPYDPNFQDRWNNQNIFFKFKHRYNMASDSIKSLIKCPKCNTPLPNDPIVNVLTDMITALMNLVAAQHPSLSEFISLSRPDFDWRTQLHHGRFTLATHKAGFRNFASHHDLISSISALWSLGILDCADELCEGKPRVLVLLYTNSTLVTTSMNSGAEYYPCRVRNHLDLGAENVLRLEEPARYWQQVKLAVQDALAPTCDGRGRSPSKPTRIEQIIVLGERGNDRAFLEALQDIHGGMPRIRAVSGDEHIFAAARGAAAQARLGMSDGFNGCIPNGWCAEAPEDKNVVVNEADALQKIGNGDSTVCKGEL